MRRNKSRSARFARAFTIAEVLTVLVLFGLLLTTIAAVVPAILRSPAQMQAQVDEVNAAALALYKVQRDTRQSDVNGVFNCATTPVVTCTQVTGLKPAITQAIAIAGDNGATQFVDQFGQTKWKGYVVYWLAPSTSGVGLDLMRGFVGVAFQYNGRDHGRVTVRRRARRAPTARERDACRRHRRAADGRRCQPRRPDQRHAARQYVCAQLKRSARPAAS
jgi:type II secretory pathway pseudopilin PulG